ncbi:hypothetical protein P170DRAFT_240652 [Aspergillus steynii IBT 23096]|uniref:Uncharacterized protein n=1 Tax=Aspergillus steynii IBT 23096 TaxID=1392250 RepID=A0A2I2G3G3_9EURO|nr:uncharacterized protein P170DRAFT_240652 [Aspergillus steynii IBT 23096]PLB47413.1 hypothetical protein P170DRAFT_240652 [Aspergillus steynii IBT 23096]
MNRTFIPVWVIVHVEHKWTSRLNMYVHILRALADDNFSIVTHHYSLGPELVNGGYVIPVQAQGHIPVYDQRPLIRRMAETWVHELYQHAREEEQRDSNSLPVEQSRSSETAQTGQGAQVAQPSQTYRPYRPPQPAQPSHAPPGGYRPYRPPAS